MKEQIINVEGMSCGHCKQAVEELVGQLIGVKEVVASPDDNQVRVIYEDPASIIISKMLFSMLDMKLFKKSFI